MKKFLLLALLISGTSHAQLFNGLFSSRSGGMGNGGHPYEIEFFNYADEAVLLLKDERLNKDVELQTLNLYQIEFMTKTMTVEVKKKTLKDKYGRIKCALNFPGEKLIQFNKKCWEQIKSDKYLTIPFVLHEILGLTQEEIDNYDTSSKIMSLVRQKDEIVKRETEAKKAEEERLKDEKRNEEKREREEKLARIKSTFRSFSLTKEEIAKFGNIKEVVGIPMSSLAAFYDKSAYNADIIEINVQAQMNICKDLGYVFTLGLSYNNETRDINLEVHKVHAKNEYENYIHTYILGESASFMVSEVKCGK